MLPVVDKPVVQYVIEELGAAGIRRVLFVTGRRKRAIEDHFDTDPELEGATGDSSVPGGGLRLLYTRQPRPRGLGDAIRCGEDFAGGRPVVVALGDAIIAPARQGGPGIVSRLIEGHGRHGAAATVAVTEVPDDAIRRYGIVATREASDGALEITNVIEKPEAARAPSRTAVAARYVLGPEVFEALAQIEPEGEDELGLTDALAQVMASGGRVIAVPLAPGERRHDIGTIESYCEVFLEHALADPRFGASLRARTAELLRGVERDDT
jgi:UTP--glucose-1-phosphate uridylyltransferase